jgi:hypothetical protein
MDALKDSLQWERAADMSEAAETVLGDVDIASRAELVRRAAEYRGEREGVRTGLRLIDEALDLYARLPAGPGQLRALDMKRGLLMEVGRYDDAMSLARAAVRAAPSVGDRLLHRHLLTSLAWHEGLDGTHRATLDLLAHGQALVPAGTDPVGDIRAAVMATDVLLMCGRPAEEVEQAARPGLAVALEWGIDNEASMILVSNLATAMLRAGLVARAEAVLADPLDRPPDPDHWPVDSLRASVDARKGSLPAAAERIRVALGVGAPDEIDLETLCEGADIDFWCHEVRFTLPRLLTELGVVVDTAPVRILLPALVAAARGAAEESLAGEAGALDPVRDLVSRVSHRLRPADARDPQVRTHLGTAAAELARAARRDRLATWADAARGWDGLGRPHDVAYCRWRGAQVALREGQTTAATKLLRRAARDAREHVPLSAAITRTAAYAQGP